LKERKSDDMVLTIFTIFHVALSLVGIGAGFIVVFGLLGGKRLNGWTPLFLVTTVLTSVTGFLFPVHHFLPSHGVGIISLIVLAVAIYALYARHLAGGWSRIYAVNTVIALYLNFFVLIVQLFEKVPALKAQGSGPDADGVAVQSNADNGIDCISGAYDFRGNQVPDGSGADRVVARWRLSGCGGDRLLWQG
jgi:hypothetical protein